MRDELAASGIVKIEGVFSRADAARMRDITWAALYRRYGIERDDPRSWHRHPPNRLQKLRTHQAFAPTVGPRLTRVFDDVFGRGRWQRPKHYGQFLVTMPNAREWRVPHTLWHADFQYSQPARPLFAVKYWALFDDLDPGGGATVQLAGSHRLAARFVSDLGPHEREYKRVRDGLMRSHPWLRALTTADDDPERNARFMAGPTEIDGIPVQVVECTGSAGDVYVTHPWVMHCIAPNATGRPRFMRAMAVARTEIPQSDG